MDVVNYTEFRNNLKRSLDKVSDDEEVVIVSRSRNKNVVVLSLKEYNSLTETIHLLGSENNRQRLSDAIRELESGESLKNSLID